MLSEEKKKKAQQAGEEGTKLLEINRKTQEDEDKLVGVEVGSDSDDSNDEKKRGKKDDEHKSKKAPKGNKVFEEDKN
jgi:hypothetical protein